jgi:MFS family permease
LTQFFEPVVRASVSNLVSKKELTRGNAALGTTESIGYLVGPPLGGLLITWFSVEKVLVLNGITFYDSRFIDHKNQDPVG